MRKVATGSRALAQIRKNRMRSSGAMVDRRHVLLGLSGPAWAQPAARIRLAVTVLPPYVLAAGHPLGDGIDVDWVRELLRPAGLTLEVQRMPWRRVLAQLQSGEADLTTGIRLTPEREQFLRFTRGYGDPVRHAFYTARSRGLQLRQLSELRGLQIGIVGGYAFPPALRPWLRQPAAQPASIETLLRMAAAGRFDVAVVNELPGRWLVRELGLDDQLVLQPLRSESRELTHLGISRKSPWAERLHPLLDEGQGRSHDRWQRLIRHYLSPTPTPAVPPRSGDAGSS